MGFLDIGKSEVQAVMRIPRQLPVERIDSPVQTSSNHHTHCRLYHTPNVPVTIVEHPGAPSLPPSAVRTLRPRTKSDSDRSRASLIRHYNARITKHNLTLETFKAQKVIWDAKYKEYVDSLNLESIAEVVDDQDVVPEAGSAGMRNPAKASIHTPAKHLIFSTYPLVRDLNYRRWGSASSREPSARGPASNARQVLVDKVDQGRPFLQTMTLEEMKNTLDVAGQIAAIWAKEEKLDPDLSELVLKSRFETGKAEWTGWQAPAPGTLKPGAFFTVSAEGGDMPAGGASIQSSLPGSESRWKGNKGK
ncbi:hypothetical protein BKA65DRAFT_548962 [Rhexocercosporidium sp. MPI-PUGE-AT-0058]|nr:hypothetical protein BKA65DRAFT_548962 [Rhexocercosporidium sp. MPI-PUGE-AT-0058]